MEQAIIAILDEHDKAKRQIQVQFNPSEYSVSRTPKYTKDTPLTPQAKAQQFTAEDKATFQCKLTLDGFTQMDTLDPEMAADVYEDSQFFRSMISVDESLHKPPLCRFTWGSFSFVGHADTMRINYTMFASNGKPIRATVDLSLTDAENKTVALQSPDRTKRKVLTQGTPLYMVAYEAYNDPAEWRLIATANGIKNPRLPDEGIILKIPPMAFDAP